MRPSLTTPIALVQHAAAAERVWFRRSLAGRSPEEIVGIADGSDISFEGGEEQILRAD